MGIWDEIKDDAKWVVDKAEGATKWSVQQGENVVKNTESSISGIISTPLLLIGAGVMFFLWNSNLGQTQELQKAAPLLMG